DEPSKPKTPSPRRTQVVRDERIRVLRVTTLLRQGLAAMASALTAGLPPLGRGSHAPIGREETPAISCALTGATRLGLLCLRRTLAGPFAPEMFNRQLRDEFTAVAIPASHHPPALCIARCGYCFPSSPLAYGADRSSSHISLRI